jgi:hypothetical protein
MAWSMGLLTMVTFQNTKANEQIRDDKYGDPQAEELSHS